MTSKTTLGWSALALLVAALCTPAPALSAGTGVLSLDAAGTKVCDVAINPGTRCFYNFNDATDSVAFFIGATNGASICLDPNTASATATANAQVVIRWCTGDLSDTTANTCGAVLAKTLTGDASTNSECVYDVPRGIAWIDVTQSAGGQSARVLIQGN